MKTMEWQPTNEAVKQTMELTGATRDQVISQFSKNRAELLAMAEKAKASGGKAGGNTELQWLILAASLGTLPCTKARSKALTAVKWRLREACGDYIGMEGLETVLTTQDKALVFDGRDNEARKLSYFKALTGGTFSIEQVLTPQ